MIQKPSLVILAAGMGSRYGGLKQLDGVGPSQEVIIEYSIYDAIRAGFGKVVFVIRRDIEAAFREQIGSKFEDKIEIAYVFQEKDSDLPEGMSGEHREKPWGTGHAMLVAHTAVNEPFAVINADDYYGVDAFQTAAAFLVDQCKPDTFAMVGYELMNTLSSYGHVNRGVATMDANTLLTDVEERLKIEQSADQVSYLGEDGNRHQLAKDSIVSMNFWCLHPEVFVETMRQFHDFVHSHKDEPKAEFLIPTVVDHMIKTDAAHVKVLQSKDRWYGVTYRDDKPSVVKAFSSLVSDKVYPSPLWG